MLFRAATLREPTGFLNGLAGGSHTALHALLGENMIDNANSAVNVTNHSIVQLSDEKRKVDQKFDAEDANRDLLRVNQIIMSNALHQKMNSQHGLPIFEHGKEEQGMDWF